MFQRRPSHRRHQEGTGVCPTSQLLALITPTQMSSGVLLRLQMTKGNVGSLLVFDPSKITIDQPVKEASGEAVVGIVTERGVPPLLGLPQL